MAKYAQGVFVPKNPEKSLALVPTLINKSGGNTMIQCKLCGTECKSIRSLSKHLRDQHEGYSLRAYYDEFVAESSAKCVICGSDDVGFISLLKGYNPTCSHKCGCTHHRAKLKNDPERHAKFTQKLAEHQTKVWQERESSGEKKAIFEKVSNTLLDKYQLMSDDERKEKCGWLNNISQEEKEKWKSEVMMNTGAHLWWREAHEDVKNEVVLKRNAARFGISIEEYLEKLESAPEQKKYSRECRLLTEKNYRLFKHQIDPENKRGRDYHLDHRYSVIHGFINNVSPEIIASPFNLEILRSTENAHKFSNSSITLEQLMEMCNG
jgi:hypothetical protein